ncbi:hypothetical protein CCMSSC00406_0007198 [Pleurotus cornucopiae]|uniref:Uncharacterized protein n=1 Tax=Pleurotus cornucopiae TaxID=5321 RepID=A0ACB7IVJ7_PLECO|nr:hypothetical protein CCMSSC00406_0007198 [Pleurotus cornucopiae]
MSYSTTRPTAAQPYDRQRRPALLGRDTSVEVGGPSTWAGALDSTTPAYSWPPAVTPNPINPVAPEQATPPQGPTDIVASRASRALPRIPRGAPPPLLPPGPPTPPPPPAPLVKLPPAPQARNYGPKMARPEVFDGERAKCCGFIRNIEVYIFVNTYQFPNEATKVLYLLSYVQGKKVDNWKNTMTTKVLEWTRTHVHDEQVSSFRRICRSLQEAFGDPNPRDTAVTALTHLHQGSDTAEDYVMKRPLPTNCEEWQDEAIALDRQWREAQAYAKSAPAKPAARAATTTAPQNQWRPYYQRQTPPQQNQQQQQPQQQARPTPPAPQIAARDPNAMDVDRSQRTPIRCYKCGGLGHMARDCKRRLDVRQMTYEDQQDYWREELTRQGFSEGTQEAST